MKVENQILVYEINGNKTKIDDNRTLKIRNVGNRDHLVEIQIFDGETITVLAEDLLKAIKNATNNERI